MMKKVINLVNFVRGCEPRKPQTDLLFPVAQELHYGMEKGLKQTFLLQYDALIRPDFQALFRDHCSENVELGLWFEMGRPLTEAVGVPWRGRQGFDWDWYVDPGFLPAYTPEERESLIDETFAMFHRVFGFYPKSAGSWLLDAHSMAYMSDRYHVKAFCICREQYAVDAYTLWGGYYSGGYYPSRNNMLCPAQSPQNQINTPVFRMLGIDPIYGYDEGKYAPKYSGCYTMEPVWPSGKDSSVMDWYFRTYYQNSVISLSHCTTGQENSFGWEKLGAGYLMQLDRIGQLEKAGILEVQTLGETGEWFLQTFPATPPSVLCATEDWSENGNVSLWYSSAIYRADLFLHGSRLFFRDIQMFDDHYPERYLYTPCRSWDARYDNLPIVDGRLWSDPSSQKECFLQLEKAVCAIDVEQEGTRLLVKVTFADQTKGMIRLSEDKILLENCGAMRYEYGTPGSEIRLCEDGIAYRYNGFAYRMKLQADLKQTGGGYIFTPQKGLIELLPTVCDN